MKALSLIGLALAATLPSLHAQWQTQRFQVKSGWNAIYPFVDASDVRLIDLTDDRIEEIWMWNPRALDQVVLDSPQSPPQGNQPVGDEWKRWRRGLPLDSSFENLLPNAGYLVKVKDGSGTFHLDIKGKIVVPKVTWRNDGLNLVGFPAASPSPQLGPYLSPSGFVSNQTPIFRYLGGPLTNNPHKLLNPVSLPLPRGEAFWIKTGRFSDYTGPFSVEVSLSDNGLSFGETGTARQLILRNRTDRKLMISLKNENSETDRDGSPINPISLRHRVFNQDEQQYEYPELADLQLRLRPGETLSKVIVIDRSSLSTNQANGSILQIADSEGLSRIDVPVTADAADFAGLWIGEARVSRVQNQLQKFQRDENNNYVYETADIEFPPGSGKMRQTRRRIPIGDGDSELQSTAQSFPLRLIFHVGDDGKARLLSTVYAGLIANSVPNQDPAFGIATSQALLDAAHLKNATRITAVHFPLDLSLALASDFGPNSSLEGSFTVGHDAKDNPFIHAYHPDHDNLDPTFERAQPAGRESHRITRELTLTFHSAAPDNNPAWGSQILTGTYAETLKGLHKEDLDVEGSFVLRRLSRDRTLHTP